MTTPKRHYYWNYIYISNYSKKLYTINGHSSSDLFPSSSIPPPGKWSDRTKEELMFLSHTPSLLWCGRRTSYNKKYREGFRREFLHTVAVGIDRTCRVRLIPMAKVCNPDSISLFYLPFPTFYDAKICQNISKQS